MAIFRSFSRMAFYLPRKPFDNMIEGFKFDIEKKFLKTENELCRHAKCISASPVTIMLFLMWNKGGDWPIGRTISCDLIDNDHVFGEVSGFFSYCFMLKKKCMGFICRLHR